MFPDVPILITGQKLHIKPRYTVIQCLVTYGRALCMDGKSPYEKFPERIERVVRIDGVERAVRIDGLSLERVFYQWMLSLKLIMDLLINLQQFLTRTNKLSYRHQITHYQKNLLKHRK